MCHVNYQSYIKFWNIIYRKPTKGQGEKKSNTEESVKQQPLTNENKLFSIDILYMNM